MTEIYTLGIWQDVMHGGNTMTLSQALYIAIVGLCIVLAELAIISIFIKILSSVIQALAKNKQGEVEVPDNATAAMPVAPVAAAPAGTPLPDTQSAGRLDLINVDEPTAAVIMAIVSDESGIPLNRLAFKSIKLVEE